MTSQIKYECYSHIRVASSCFSLLQVITEENSTLVHLQGCCLLTANILNQLNDEWLSNNKGPKHGIVDTRVHLVCVKFIF